MNAGLRASRGSRAGPLGIGGLVEFGDAFSPFEFFLPLGFDLGVIAAPDQFEAKRHDMRADDATLLAVAAGAVILGGSVLQDANGCLEGAIAPEQGPGYKGFLVGDILNQAPVNQGLGVLEDPLASPVDEDLVGYGRPAHGDRFRHSVVHSPNCTESTTANPSAS